MENRRQLRLSRVDAAAICVFFAVWIYHIWMVRYGHCSADESYFIVTAQRYLCGDRPLVDEWFPGQLCCVFLCLPYRIYVALRGSTVGIVLYFRYLFLAFNAAFSAVMYLRLRAYRWHALLATLLFSLYVPATIFTFGYNTVAPRLLMLVCLILFGEKQRPLSLVIAGVLLSCAVIYEPGFAVLYLAFSVLVWVRAFRQRKGKAFLDDYTACLTVRAWKYLSLSVFVCAAVFCVWLFAKSGVRNILTAVPYILTDPEYDYSSGGKAWGVFFRKLAQAGRMYGAVCWIPALVIAALSAAYACGAFRSRRETARGLLFCFACPVWILGCVPMVRYLFASLYDAAIPDVFYISYPAPMLWFGLVCYLLCEQKNKRLFPFWITALAASLCVDFFSDVSLFFGAPIAYFADLVFFADLTRELRADADPAKKTLDMIRRRKQIKRLAFSVRWLSRAVCVCFAVWFACTFVHENTSYLEHYIFGKPLFALSFRCTQGPWRSLYCTQEYGGVYEQMIADVDALKKTQPKNLFVCGKEPELYLHAELPFSTCFTIPDTEIPAQVERNVQYWKLHPERLPECVYVPFDRKYVSDTDDSVFREETRGKIRECFDPICDYTAKEGQGGYILYVSQWHLNEE